MKNIINNWNKLSLKILILFGVTMLLTFLPDHLRDFFGDKLYIIPEGTDKYDMPNRHDFLDIDWDWGWRHHIYFLMCLLLFTVQAVKIIVWIDKNDFKS